MRIAEIMMAEAMDPLAKQLKDQARAAENKKLRQQQKTPSYYVQFHVYPDLQKTAAMWWVTPKELHYTYDEAAASGQAKRLSTENTISSVAKLVYELGDYYAPALKQKRVELIVPSRLKTQLPTLYTLLKEWQYRVEAGNNRLISFADKLPTVQQSPVVAKSTSRTAASTSYGASISDAAIEKRMIEIFRSQPQLSAAFRERRNIAGMTQEIKQHIRDYWEDPSAAIEEISATLGVQ